MKGKSLGSGRYFTQALFGDDDSCRHVHELQSHLQAGSSGGAGDKMRKVYVLISSSSTAGIVGAY